MGELQKKWFQIIWACLLFASIAIKYIQRMTDVMWAHGEAIEMLERVLNWIIIPMTVVLFVLLCVGYWRQSKRLFWRMWRRWGSALLIGAVCAVVLVLLMRYMKGDNLTIGEEDSRLLFGVFAAGGLIYGIARYKFNHWRKDGE